LRSEVEQGQWTEKTPGVGYLAAELGVNRKTVAAALRGMEVEGMLVSQGVGRKRQIVLPEGKATRPLRVAILDHDPLALTEMTIVPSPCASRRSRTSAGTPARCCAASSLGRII